MGSSSQIQQNNHKRVALCAACLALFAACDQTLPMPDTPAPKLTLKQTGTNTVDLKISGRYALRAMQARLTYDSAAMRLLKVEAGKESSRLDRVFFSDPKKADGGCNIGITDTRKVLLPSRGALFRFTFEARGSGQGTVRIEHPLGALGVGERVDLARTSLGVLIK